MKIRTSIIIGLTIVSATVFGQKEEKELQGEEVSVEASYKPYVPKATKIKIQPKVEKDKMEKPDFNYVLEPITLESKIELKSIVAARVRNSSNRKDFPSNYVKAGFGNYTSPLVEFSASNKQSKEYAYGLFLKHESSWRKYKEAGFPGYNNNQAQVYFSRFFNRHTLQIKPFYQRNGYHFYGTILEDTIISKDFTPDVIASKMGVDVGFYSHDKEDVMIQKDLQLHYDYMNSFLESRSIVKEHLIGLQSKLYHDVQWINNSDKQKIGANIEANFVERADVFQGVLGVSPRYSFARGIYELEVGVNSATIFDRVTKLDFFPYLKAEFNVIPDFLKLYFTLDGNVKHNTYHSLIEENPFILVGQVSTYTKTRWAKEGGIKGNIAKSLDFNLSFMNAKVEDMVFYGQSLLMSVPEGTNFVNFSPIYDTVNYSRVALDLNYQFGDKVQSQFHIQYDNYNTSNLEFAYFKPEITSHLLLNYQLNEKIKLNTTFQFIGKRKYYDLLKPLEIPPYEIIELDPVIDINLGGEYQISDTFSAFLDLNNILNRRHYVQAYYPTKRFNFMAGVKFRF